MAQIEMKRILYFFYYLRELNTAKAAKFLRHAHATTGHSYAWIIIDAVYCSFRYNISILDYFYFRFYEKTNGEQRKLWAGTGFMYEYQLKMNPVGSRELLENKVRFLINLRDLVKRRFNILTELENDPNLVEKWLRESGKRFVLKNSRGQVGAEVEVVEASDFTPDLLTGYMKRKNFDLIEEHITQHPDLMRLSPAGLNTVRIITQLQNDKVVILAARLRITINSAVDNLAAGNIAAPVDLATGKVYGPGIYSDITKLDVAIHPITGQPIEGFKIPFWEKVIDLVEQAAGRVDYNRSVGWDVAITPSDVLLVEGNHNWCKLLWQLPVKKGLKQEISHF